MLCIEPLTIGIALWFAAVDTVHPGDGWQVRANESQGIIFEQPVTLEERRDVAYTCQLGLDISIPMLIDDMDNTAEIALKNLIVDK